MSSETNSATVAAVVNGERKPKQEREYVLLKRNPDEGSEYRMILDRVVLSDIDNAAMTDGEGDYVRIPVAEWKKFRVREVKREPEMVIEPAE